MHNLIPLSLLIYIFPFLCIDTNIDHIKRHNIWGHNGQYWRNGHYGMAFNGQEQNWYWCLFEAQEKFRSGVKVDLKIMHRLKSYGQNKIFRQKVAKNGRFTLYFVPKLNWWPLSGLWKKFIFLIFCLLMSLVREG